MIASNNILQHEFIGLDTKVVDSTNSEIIGLNGTIINETKSMFTLKTKKGKKTIPKNHSSWKFTLENQDVTVEGLKIAKRSFDRLRVKV